MQNKTKGVSMWRRSIIGVLCLFALAWIGVAFWVGSWVMVKFIISGIKALNWTKMFISMMGC